MKLPFVMEDLEAKVYYKSAMANDLCHLRTFRL